MCLTDTQTVETIVRDIFDQFLKQVKESKDIKLNLRVGTLSIKNGLALFTPKSLSTVPTSDFSSVQTPSVIQSIGDLATIVDRPSNPNTAAADQRRTNVNGAWNELERRSFKFTKRMQFDKTITNSALMESHLNAVHEQRLKQNSRQAKSIERATTDRLKAEHDLLQDQQASEKRKFL